MLAYQMKHAPATIEIGGVDFVPGLEAAIGVMRDRVDERKGELKDANDPYQFMALRGAIKDIEELIGDLQVLVDLEQGKIVEAGA